MELKPLKTTNGCQITTKSSAITIISSELFLHDGDRTK